MSIDIVIPARYGSKRLPGKPLVKIAGRTMLARVVDVALAAAQGYPDVSVLVATDDTRIANHCDEIGVKWVMTPEDCASGTDRIIEVLKQRDPQPDFVINLQGDSPITPPHYVTALIDLFIKNPTVQVVTPVTQLTWDALDTLKENKKTTPFSGTCAIIDSNGRALWFSKNIIPAIRNEGKHREASELSPVFKHIGLYGYSRSLLETYGTWEMSHYEKIEGLEQLRILENGHTIHTAVVENHGIPVIGVDSPEDVTRVEALLAQYPELTIKTGTRV